MKSAPRRSRWKRLVIALALITLLGLVSAIGLRWWTHAHYAAQTFTRVADVPTGAEPRIAIVFGAGLWRGGGPSAVLYDRVATAAELYRAGKVQKLLLTGDNRFKNYNEPDVMRETALKMGIPAKDLVPDYAGRRTYDSCYRAREIFGVRRAVLITQEFHLDRALYVCDSFGIDSIGLTADRRAYPRAARLRWRVREFLATVSAWSDLNFLHPAPVLGDKIPIALGQVKRAHVGRAKCRVWGCFRRAIKIIVPRDDDLISKPQS